MGRIGVQNLPHAKVGRLESRCSVTRKLGELSKGEKQMNVTYTTCASPGQTEARDLNNWSRCLRRVRKLQAHIVKAIQESGWNTVKVLKHLLTHPLTAKAQAVKRVIENKSYLLISL
jgi:hypothetical protein